MSTLVVVPCGKRKIWDKSPTAGPTKAKDVYIGAPFKVNREYAEKYADRWVILSAKYGFIDPGFIISENYDVTFGHPSTNPISVRALKEQVKQKALDSFDAVVVLGGKDYADVIYDAFTGLDVKVKAPVAGLALGRAMGTIRKAIDEGRRFDC
ncbi:MAG: hypothetical protein OEZ29_00470 [Candidatus Bathyarchaeota archaeon]|nr:hypothetical protein [Candidatus Bathyarchaeota archaeon]